MEDKNREFNQEEINENSAAEETAAEEMTNEIDEINEINETNEINEETPDEISAAEETGTIDKVEEALPADKPAVASKNKKIFKEMLDWIVSIAVALVAVILINQFLLIQVEVDGSSMVPTLQHGDRLFAYRLAYEPEYGDIVVLDPNQNDDSVKGKLMFDRVLYIKRVIATEGQTIDIKNGKVYVDNKPIREDYIAEGAVTRSGSTDLPLTVPKDCVFVMGDNREHSKDSRDQSVGIVSEDRLVGKAVFRLLPFDSFGPVE